MVCPRTGENLSEDALRQGRLLVSGPREIRLPLVILGLGIAQSQQHPILFWQSLVGRWSGLGWSIQLELISLWLRFNTCSEGWGCREMGNRSMLRLPALATAGILLAGPLFRIGQPVYDEWRKEFASEGELELIRNEIKEDRAGLRVYRRNSLTRLGWQGKIGEAELALRDKRNRPSALLFKYFRHKSQGTRVVPRNLIDHLAEHFLSDERKEV